MPPFKESSALRIPDSSHPPHSKPSLKLLRGGRRTAEGVIEPEDAKIEHLGSEGSEAQATDGQKKKKMPLAFKDEPFARRVAQIEKERQGVIGKKTKSEAKMYGIPEDEIEEITEMEEETPLERDLVEARGKRQDAGMGAFEELRVADMKKTAEAQRREERFSARQALEQPKREAVLARIREREERIDFLKKNVAEILAGMERMKIEAKARQDAEGVARAEKIATAVREQSERIEELRSIERSAATDRIELEERTREGALLRSENGEIVGLKNMFEVAPGDVLRATGPALDRIQEEHLWAQEHLRGGWRNRVLQDLEAEVQMWAKMAEQAIMDQNAGNIGEGEKPTVANLFYRRPQAEGVPVLMQERIERSPMEELRDQYDALSETESDLAEVLQESRQAYESILNVVDKKEAVTSALKKMQHVSELLDGTYARTVKRLNREHEEAKREQSRGDVDERGLRIAKTLEEAEVDAKQAKQALKMFKGGADMKKELKAELEAAEDRVMELRGERNLWRENPRRELVLKQRREQAAASVDDLFSRIAKVELMQSANKQAMEQRALLLGRGTNDLVVLEEQLESDFMAFVGVTSEYYDIKTEAGATIREIVRRAAEEMESNQREAA